MLPFAVEFNAGVVVVVGAVVAAVVIVVFGAAVVVVVTVVFGATVVVTVVVTVAFGDISRTKSILINISVSSRVVPIGFWSSARILYF